MSSKIENSIDLIDNIQDLKDEITTKKSINNKRLKAIKNLEDFYNM